MRLGAAASLTAFFGRRASAATTVTIAMQNGIGYLPIIVADALGLFDKHVAALGASGTKVAIKKLSGAPAINDSLLSGSIEIGAYGAPGLLVAWEKTRKSYDIRGLTPLSMSRYSLYASDPAIKTVADFPRTSRIAVTALNSPQAILLRMAAVKAMGEAAIKHFDTMMIGLPHPDENARLKKLLAEQMIDNAILKDVAAKNGDARCEADGGGSCLHGACGEPASAVPGLEDRPLDGALHEHPSRRCRWA